MTNIKRRGVLAALLGICGAAQGQKRSEPKPKPPLTQEQWPAVKLDSVRVYAAFEIDDNTAQTEYFLVVKADNRIAKFTAKEVMDILEGK